MYIENVTELAFDDITPEDPDFPFIQGGHWSVFTFMLKQGSYYVNLFSSLNSIGLAEAGLISSKLSNNNMPSAESSRFTFSPER